MNALKAEIALKRKTVEADLTSRPTKYMRRGDIERLKQEEEQKAKQERQRAVQDETHIKDQDIDSENGKADANVSNPPRVVPVSFTCQ